MIWIPTLWDEFSNRSWLTCRKPSRGYELYPPELVRVKVGPKYTFSPVLGAFSGRLHIYIASRPIPYPYIIFAVIVVVTGPKAKVSDSF